MSYGMPLWEVNMNGNVGNNGNVNRNGMNSYARAATLRAKGVREYGMCGCRRKRNWEDRHPVLASLLLLVLGGAALFFGLFW